MYKEIDYQEDAECAFFEVTEDLAHIATWPITSESIALGWQLYAEALALKNHTLAPFALTVANHLTCEDMPAPSKNTIRALGNLDKRASLNPMNLVKEHYDFDTVALQQATNFFALMTATKTQEDLALIPPEDIPAAIQKGLALCA